MAMKTASSSSSSDFRRYDIFLSFRGEDTRLAFTGHLYDKLREAGFHVFLDDHGIERGEDIKSELRKAIQESRSTIIVLSKDYVSSEWCLDELVMILRRKRTGKFWVLPVFYQVDPSDLREQTGSVAEAFHEHERSSTRGSQNIAQWREVLTEVTNLTSGITYKGKVDGYEFECINKIIKEVKDSLGSSALRTDSFLVGLGSRVRMIKQWLEDSSAGDNVDVLVVCGNRGIGKTTSVKLVYNDVRSRFDGCSFLTSVREFFGRPNGLLELQRKLLSDILGQHKAKMLPPSPEDGWSLIRRALRSKGKFLLILDDVDESSQLDKILELKDWFSKGSKIVITTMRSDLFPAKINHVYKIHKIQNLGYQESKTLFCWHAFGEEIPMEDYRVLVECFVAHCDGHPLALKVLGSSLRQKSLPQWNDQLKKMQEIPKTDILGTIKLSYLSLEDSYGDKNIFLDIACFFVGRDADFVIKILNGCNSYNNIATFGMQNLIDRSLLTVDEENKLVMHQLIQDLAKQIIRENLESYPEKRSRLWNYRDSIDVLRSKAGTEAIEGLILDVQNSNTKTFETDAFKNMHQLRILQLNHAKLNGSFRVMPKNLKCLCWHGFPEKSIPNDFLLEELIALDMRHSSLKILWKGKKILMSLRILDLCHCPLLVETSDFSMAPNLEELLLKDCLNLVRLHASTSTLDKLTILNLEDCARLKKLPRNIGALKSLELLIISGCTSLEGLDEELGKMTSLKRLIADRINPLHKRHMLFDKNTYHLCPIPTWYWLSKQKIGQPFWTYLPNSLVNLSLENCNLFYGDFPQDFSNLTMLKCLNLGRNPFRCLPNCFKGLPKLSRLILKECRELQLLEWSSLQLNNVDVSDCHSLEKIAYNTLDAPRRCMIKDNGCKKLSQVKDYYRVKPVREMDAEALKTLGFFNLPCKQDTKVEYDSDGVFSTWYPGKELPTWLSHRSKSSVISFISPNVRIRGLNICFVYVNGGGARVRTFVINKSKNLANDSNLKLKQNEPDQGMVWLTYWPFGVVFDGGDIVEVSFHINTEQFDEIEIKEWGIRFLYDEDHKQDVHNLKYLLCSGLFQEFLCDNLEVRENYAVFSTNIPENNIPDWFINFKSNSSVISLKVPPHSERRVRIRSVNLFVAFTVFAGCGIWLGIQAILINKRKNIVAHCDMASPSPHNNAVDRVWFSHWLFDSDVQVESGDDLEASFHVMTDNGKIRECGINFLYHEDFDDNINREQQQQQQKGIMSYKFDSSPFVSAFTVFLDAHKFTSVVPKGFFDGDFRVSILYRPWPSLCDYHYFGEEELS